jgi:hypothetical protein
MTTLTRSNKLFLYSLAPWPKLQQLSNNTRKPIFRVVVIYEQSVLARYQLYYSRDPNLRNALKRRGGLAGIAPEALKFKRNPHMAHFGQYKNKNKLSRPCWSCSSFCCCHLLRYRCVRLTLLSFRKCSFFISISRPANAGIDGDGGTLFLTSGGITF